MKNQSLTAFDTETPAFNMVAQHCPFCGDSVADPQLVGVNCEACPPCSEAIQFFTPTVAHVYGETNTFDVWVYLPTADNWDREANPVFLDSVNNDDVIAANSAHPDELTYSGLTDAEQAIVQVLAETQSAASHADLTAVDTAELWSDAVTAINPFRNRPHPLEKTTVDTLISRIPRPTVLAGTTMHTANPTELRDELTQNNTNTEQTSLTGQPEP